MLKDRTVGTLRSKIIYSNKIDRTLEHPMEVAVVVAAVIDKFLMEVIIQGNINNISKKIIINIIEVVIIIKKEDTSKINGDQKTIIKITRAIIEEVEEEVITIITNIKIREIIIRTINLITKEVTNSNLM